MRSGKKGKEGTGGEGGKEARMGTKGRLTEGEREDLREDGRGRV